MTLVLQLDHDIVGEMEVDASDPKNVRLCLTPKIVTQILKWQKESQRAAQSASGGEALVLLPAKSLKDRVAPAPESPQPAGEARTYI